MGKLIEKYGVNIEAFEERKARGDNPDTLKVYLLEEYGVPFGKVTDLYRELGGGRARRLGFRDLYYAYLRVEPRSRSEAEAYVRENGSGNDVRHLSQYLQIADLALAIHKSK